MSGNGKYVAGHGTGGTCAVAHFRRLATVALGACGAGAGVPAVGQPVIEVSGEVSCAECRIVVDTVATLGGLDAPGAHLVSRDSDVAVDQRGRLLLTAIRPVIAVFDSAGTFVREIGGSGEGPGEYVAITHINVGPRFIHVFDPDRGRTLLDADHRFVRLDRLVADVNSAATTESGTVVFGGDLRTPEAIGHHLHLLEVGGELRSYGWDGSAYTALTRRRYGVAAHDSLAWLIRSGRIEEWALLPEPKLMRIVDRYVEEFERERPSPSEYRGPSTHTRAQRVDERGLWVLWTTPDRGWTRRTNDPSEMDRWDQEATPQAIEDGVLDLVDPETMRTLARYRSDLPLLDFAHGSDMILAYEETEEGVPWLHLLRPRLEFK